MTDSHHSNPHNASIGSNLAVGGAIGILLAFTSIAFGSVIFSGELSEHLPAGVGLLLFSTFAVATIVASLSAYPAIVASPQDTTIPVLALVARHIVEKFPPEAASEERFYTVVATLTLNSLVIALIFLALGKFKLGGLIRFIPYPVVAGFLAGMGVLLIKGAFHSLNGVDHHHFELASLLQQNVLLQWLPGLGFALVLFVVSQYVHKFWVIPTVIVGAIALFYLGLFVSGTSLQVAGAEGLLLGNPPTDPLFQFVTIPALTHADWPIVFKQIPDLAALWLIDAIALLFTISGIELRTSRDLDLNHELQVAGLASLGAGLGGGVGGFPVLGETNLAHHLGGTRRIVGWTVAGICLMFLIAGAGLLPLIPKLIVIGVPILLGMELLYEWLYRSWFKFSVVDFAIIALIVLVITTIGYLPGIAVGLLAALILFVIDFSRVSVIKHEMSGSHHHSHVVRSPQQQQFLQRKGEQLQILELQGFIFFGTANHLLNRVKQLLNMPPAVPKFLVIDFRQVTGLDSSAVISFVKLKQLATEHEFHLVLTGLKPSMEKFLMRGLKEREDGCCEYLPDLDRGLEWCEAQILEASSWRRSRYMPLPLLLKNLFPDSNQVSQFIPYLEKQQLGPETVLFQQDVSPDALFFVELGQLSTFFTSETGQTRRVRTLGPGTVVGEIAFFTRSPYKATAIADQPSTLYRLSIESLQRMVQENPQTAAVFQEFMLSHMAERLVQANEEIKKLLL